MYIHIIKNEDFIFVNKKYISKQMDYQKKKNKWYFKFYKVLWLVRKVLSQYWIKGAINGFETWLTWNFCSVIITYNSQAYWSSLPWTAVCVRPFWLINQVRLCLRWPYKIYLSGWIVLESVVQCSSVGIAIELKAGRSGDRIPVGGGEIFRICPDRPWGPSQPTVQWVPGLSQG